MDDNLQTILDSLNKQIGSLALMINIQPPSKSRDMLEQYVDLLSQLILDALNAKNKMDS